MKSSALLILSLLIGLFSYCQEISGVKINNTKTYSEDSDIYVRYLNPKSDVKHNAAVFINNEFFKNGYTLLRTVAPNKIESVNVEKGTFKIDGIEYHGKILITLKTDYTPKIITLNNLITKHLTLDNNPIILQIDSNYVNDDFNNYIVDENYILQINATTVTTSKNGKINMLYLMTKSDKNIEKANQPKQIIIRGTE